MEISIICSIGLRRCMDFFLLFLLLWFWVWFLVLWMSRDFLEVFSSFPTSSVNFSLVWFSSCAMFLRCSSPFLWFPKFPLAWFSKKFLLPLLYWTPWIFSWVETKFRTWKKRNYHIFHFNWTFLKGKLVDFFFKYLI